MCKVASSVEKLIFCLLPVVWFLPKLSPLLFLITLCSVWLFLLRSLTVSIGLVGVSYRAPQREKKIHLICWKKITKPKREGGLGIQVAKAKNSALLAKLNWRLHSETSSLWARVLIQKYKNLRRRSNLSAKFRSCSATWAAVRKGENLFKLGSKWVVGRNSHLSF